MPKITLLFAALHVLLMLALLAPISRHRHAHRIGLGVKSRLVINALLEQFRFFGVPVFQGLNR